MTLPTRHQSEIKGEKGAAGAINVAKIEGAAAVAAGSAIAENLAGVLYCHIADYLKGGYFSDEQVEVLESMKTIYRRCFEDQKLEPPAQWELREDKRPKFYMRAHSGDWTQYIDDQVFASDGFGFLHNKIVWYVRLAASYLKKRGDAGHGFAGDHIEMFFVENINWALSQLVTYSAEPGSIERLKARIIYLQQTRAIKNMFPEEAASWRIRKCASYITFHKLKHYEVPSFTHIATSLEMEEALSDIISYMENVIKLASARDIVGIIKNRFELTFGSAFDYLFTLRGKPFDRPVSLKQWLEDDEAAVAKIARKFPGVFDSHTGCMLRDLVRICDRTIFTAYVNTISTRSSMPVFGYFNSPSGYRYLTELRLKNGTPGWLLQDNSVELEFLYKYYDVCCVLRKTAQCYKLVTRAYSLAGNRGNIWAFGSAGGRARFHRLILILSDSLAELHEAIDALRLYSKSFFEAQREKVVSSSDQKHISFNTSERVYEGYISHKKRVFDQLQQLTSKISEFSECKARTIEAETRDFDVKLQQYISRFGRKSLLANLQEFPLQEGEAVDQIVIDANHAQERIQADERLQLGLDFPVVSIGGYLSLNRPEFQDFNLENHYPNQWRGDHHWNVGDSYSMWADGFVHRCKSLVKRYNESVGTLHQSLLALRNFSDSQERKRFEKAIWFEPVHNVISSINHFSTLLEQQRPKWRFGLFFWIIPYVITAGWPFHRRERKFTELFSDFLHDLRHQVSETTTRIIREIPQPHAPLEDNEVEGAPQYNVEVYAKIQEANAQLSRLYFCKVIGRIINIVRAKKQNLISLSREKLKCIALYQGNTDELGLLTEMLSRLDDNGARAYVQILYDLISRPFTEEGSQALIDAYLDRVAKHGEANTIKFIQTQLSTERLVAENEVSSSASLKI